MTVSLHPLDYSLDYTRYVNFVGTAHFTRRSFVEAVESVKKLGPANVALELDLKRYRTLSRLYTGTPWTGYRRVRNEFTGAADALGNVDANIWLIDMSEREMWWRIRRGMRNWGPLRLWRPVSVKGLTRKNVELWDRGYKEFVLKKGSEGLEDLRKRAPFIWRVLVPERNALMAARLAWIVSDSYAKRLDPRTVAVLGAAHVEGVQRLLEKPELIDEELESYGLEFTEPKRIRRVRVKTA